MATKKQTILFGINEIWMDKLCIATLKVRVNSNFPIKHLPKCVSIQEGYNKRGNAVYTLSYAEVSASKAWKVINRVGRLLREHAQKQLDARYSWVSDRHSGC